MKKGHIRAVVLGDVAEEFANDPDLAKVKGVQLIKPYRESEAGDAGEGSDGGEDEDEEAVVGELVMLGDVIHCASNLNHGLVHVHVQLYVLTVFGQNCYHLVRVSSMCSSVDSAITHVKITISLCLSPLLVCMECMLLTNIQV